MGCRFPNLFLIGAPKAGTTSLFRYITQHTDVFGARFKETHFFSDDTKYKRGEKYYLDRYFPGADGYSIRVDATPEYLRSAKKVAPRIRRCSKKSEIKFVVILRDPVERAWSNYLHRRRVGAEPLTFREALGQEQERLSENPTSFAAYFQQGLYGRHLEEWLRHYPKGQVLALRFKSFVEDPREITQRVFDFVDLGEASDLDVVEEKNAAGRPRWQWLVELYSDPPRWAKDLFHRIPLHLQHPVRRYLHRVMTVKYNSKPRPNEELERELRDRYRDDIIKLEDLLGWDLEEWK